MPQIDMPLAELKEYMGVNPCPKDFDAFWDRGIEEMHVLGVGCELVPSVFQMPYAECFDLYFTGMGGARIHAKYIRPNSELVKVEDQHPAIVQFHGYTMNAGDWHAKLHYVAMGYSVFAMDCRGQGGLSEDVGGVYGNTLFGHIVKGLDDEPEKLYYRNVFLDTAQMARIAMSMPEVDEKRVAVTGNSQGGALTLACASLEPKVAMIAPMYPFLSDYERIWDMDWDQKAYVGLRDYLRRFDPTHERHEEIFTKLGYIDIQNLAKRIRAKVLMATGLMDDVCPPSTQFAVYNKITSSKEMVIYPDYAHERFPGWGDRVMMWLKDL